MSDLEQIGPWWVLRDDTNLTPKVRASGDLCIEHELMLLPCMQALGAGDVVLDVGAFVGDTAVPLLKRGCHVYAFEPQPDAFECLRRNTERFPDVRCYNRPVGDGDYVALSDEALDGNLGTRQVLSGTSAAGDVQVTLRLDSLPLRSCRLLKIDAEGSEVFVLRGAADLIREFKPVIVVEAFDPMLAKRGFTRRDLFSELRWLDYAWEVGVGNDADERCDYVCRPRGGAD